MSRAKEFTGKLKEYLFVNRDIRQTVAKNTFWLTVGTTGSKIFRAIIVIYAARVLGTAQYGIFSYAVSLAAFFSVFADIGLSGLLTREAVKHPEKTQEYLSTTLIIKLLLSIPVIIVMFLVGDTTTKITAVRALLPLMAMLLIFDNLRNFAFSLTRAQNRMQLEAFYTILTDFAITTLGLAILFFHPTARSLAASYAFGSAIGFFGIAIALHSYFKEIFTHFKQSLVKPLLAAAWPFAVMGVFGGLLINIDTIIIGWYRSASDLGLNAAAQRPIQLLYLVPSIIASSLFPIFSRLTSTSDKGRMRELSEKSLTATIALSLPLTIGGVILGRALMVLLYGSAYIGSTLTFQILMLTLCMSFTSAITSNFIFAHDKQKIFLLSTGLGGLANTVFDFLLIPRYGIAGSACATLIAQIALNAVLWIAMKKINYFSVLPHLWKALLAALLMGAATLLMQAEGLNILANVAISGAIYFLVLKILREPLFGEIREMLRL